MTRCIYLVTTALPSLLVVLLSGCANYLAPLETKPVQPATETPHYAKLRALPAPADQVVVAVYRFRDQTGQYKASTGGASFSTAVTQGATSILVRALDESGWFIPIEREGLSNLLNERQIIQTTRVQHSGQDGQVAALPPLLYAGVLIEGGIIGYDTNVLTGGLGARYLGMGTSGQFRQDQVTVYLRAVSTQTGRVLTTVHTTKTILSQQLDASIFRYVDANRLLEIEAGYTFNEPNVVAVTQAIEEAVIGLVLQGVREELWTLANPLQVDHEAFARYDERVEAASHRDMFGRALTQPRDRFAIGLAGGVQRTYSDYADPLVQPAGMLEARRAVASRWALGLGITTGGLAADRAFDYVYGGAYALLRYRMLPRRTISPFVTAGAGALVLSGDSDLDEPVVPVVRTEAGFEVTLSPVVGWTVGLTQTYALIDALDDVQRGTANDSIWDLKTGFSFYF